MNLKNKIVLAHEGHFNATSRNLYRGNSKEVCGISGAKDYIGIIELDVRKSEDNILYCYHGSLIEYYFSLKFSNEISVLKKKYGIDTLQEILSVIPEDKIIFLDLKDTSITPDDILKSFGGKGFKQIILGNRSVAFLRRFNNLPDRFVKIMNGNIFCTLYDLKKLHDDRYKYFEIVFPFQISNKLIGRVVASGMEFRCAGLFFFNRKKYWDAIEKYHIKHVSSDFIK